MKTNQAFKLVGGLSRPSKMPGFAYGLPAKECKTGSKLQKQVKGSSLLQLLCAQGYVIDSNQFRLHNTDAWNL